MTISSSCPGLARLLAIIGAGVLAAGCAGIPHDGPVVAGGRDGSSGAAAFRALVAGPAEDDDPRQIVTGFLRSMVGVSGEFEVARTFMTAEQASTWRAGQTTVVYTGSAAIQVRQPGEDTAGGESIDSDQKAQAVVSVTEFATVDEHGEFTTAATGSRRTISVTLVRTAQGQWRISGSPDVVLLSISDFRLSYRASPVYLLTTDREYLTPVTKWFPDTPALPTRLVSELLRGPPPPLAAAMTSAIPAGTSLAPPGSVTVREGAAVVELTGPVRSVDPSQRAALSAQVTRTVRGVLPVQEVEILVDDAPLEVAPDQRAVVEHPGASAPAVLLRDDRLVRFDRGTAQPVDAIASLAGTRPSDPAASLGGDYYAFLADNRRTLRMVSPGRARQQLLSGADLTSPSIDRFDWIWSAPQASRGTLSAARRDGQVTKITARWLAGRDILSLRVSRDGTRLAVVSRGGSGTRLDIAAVRRDGDRPVAALRWADGGLDPRLADPRQAHWIDAERLAVLTGQPLPTIREAPLQGLMSEPVGDLPRDVIDIAAGDLGPRSMLACSDDGVVYVRAGQVWLPAPGLRGATDAAFPG